MNARSLARFEAKVDRSGGTEVCHKWWGSTNENGYGLVRIDGVSRRAHRVAYEITNGPIPEGMLVRHLCDNRLCCNPAHLAIGTIADNNRDRLRDGGSYFRGNKHWASKLTEADVLYARQLRKNGVPYRDIAQRLGVSYTGIHSALTGKTWAHLPLDSDLPKRVIVQRIDPDAIEMARRMRDDEGKTWREIERATGYDRLYLSEKLPRRTGFNPNPVILSPEEAQEAVRLRQAGMSWTKLSRHFGNRISRMGLYYGWRNNMKWWREAEEAVEP
jgi:hypothetical protein